MQESEPLCHDLGGEEINAGRIAARPGKAGDQAELDRVVASAEGDRDGRGCSFCRLGAEAEAGGGDHRHAAAHQFGHDCREALVLALHPVVLDGHVLALDVAGFAEAHAERRGVARRVLGRPAVDEANHRHRRLLRARRERPRCRRAAEQRDELAPS